MRQDGHDTQLVTVDNLREFFRESLDAALSRQNTDADSHTTHYVVNLLTLFARSERFYEQTGDGPTLRPLAMILSDALHGDTERERTDAFRRLGDVSLFMAGFFSDSFARRSVDVDYYVGMGAGAYSRLAELLYGTPAGRAFCDVFDELAAKFQAFVDALNEIAEMSANTDDRDIVRLYEVWLRTGSRRAASQLRRLGVVPMPGAPGRYRQ